MQLTSTTDYAIRIVCCLAAEHRMVSAMELSDELGIPVSYIPKITKQLKKNKLITAYEGTKGGYMLAAKAEDITLYQVISCTETTMCINRCLETDGYCTENKAGSCKVHKILLGIQNNYNSQLESIRVSDLVAPGADDDFDRFYVILKVDLNKKSYECIYSHSQEVCESIWQNGRYDEFTNHYIQKFIHLDDQKKIEAFLNIDDLQNERIDDCLEENIQYRRREKIDSERYVWMKMKKYVDQTQKTMILTFHNSKVIPKMLVNMENELRKREADTEKQYWNMVSLLVSVLNHNNLVEAEHQDDISFYTELVYRQMQKNCPEYDITENEIKNVSHLAPIHDIGKIKVPMEIINKPGKLTEQEREIMNQHPLTGAEMTLRFPKGVTTDQLNQYSYDICKYHHERYDGNGYPDGLKGEEIPLCAQVVGLVDAYDALISERPYKRKLKHEEAIRMIVNGECGVFSKKLICCFLAAAMQPEWIQKVNAQK